MEKFLLQPFSTGNFLLFFAAGVLMLGAVLGFVTYAIYFERKILGWMQGRHGPNRVGPFGLLQTVADVLKLLIKEDTIPRDADRTLFKLGPVIAFVPAFLVIATLPITKNIHFADLNIGVLYYVAISGITTIGVLAGGWASNNKYALLGAMRSVAQMISYEIPLVMSVVGVILLTGSMQITEIVEAQRDFMWFIIPQFLGFLIFIVSAVSELNRTPFDLPEAESELIAGYHIEYSGFRFAFYMLAEYVYVFAMSTLATALFLGGWLPPFGILENIIPGIVWFSLKLGLCFFFLVWLRGTLPRVRVDQLMALAWKILLPLALLNLFGTALLKEIFNF